MKKILVAVAVSVLASSTAFAASITNSKHDLSSGSTASIKSTETTQICAFCHTPHGAVVNVPLWNRSNPDSGSYKLYTSSSSLTDATKAATLNEKSISLLCLSCHDGLVAQVGSRVQSQPSDAVANGDVVTVTDSTATFQGNGSNLGFDLTNDHPIGFNYNDAATDDTGLQTMTDANVLLGLATGTAFYNGSLNTMECSSCHLVHDNVNGPFLRQPMDGSQLCLACHNK